jgi:CheY-like chemotaxis protein
MRGDKEQCLQAGCKDYIAKPILIPELARVLVSSTKKVVDEQQHSDHISKRRRVV